jgi:hypothetical protein
MMLIYQSNKIISKYFSEEEEEYHQASKYYLAKKYIMFYMRINSEKFK